MISSRATYEQGVLFVHGIGNQTQGDTLVRWGDALAGWLGDWGSRGESPTPVRFADVVLHPADGAPAHGDLHIGFADERVTWLVEEVWWAGEVQTPSYPRLAAFIIQALPMTLLGFVGGAIRRHRVAGRGASLPRKAYHWLWIALALLVGLPLALLAAPLVAALMVVLLVVGLVPVPGVRARVLAVQRALTLTVGDSMILLGSPTQRAAMTSRVIEAIRFARARGVNRLTIVAHSQGAAVVKRALAEHPPFVPKPRLVTVGSGVNRLEELEAQGQAEGWLAPAFLAGVGVVGWWLWLLEDAGEVTWTEVAGWALGYLAATFTVGALAVLAPRFARALAVRRVDRRIERLDGEASKKLGQLNRAQEIERATHRLGVAVAVVLLVVLMGFLLAVIVLAGDASLPIILVAAAGLLGLAALQKLVFRAPVEVTPNLEHRVDHWLDVYSNADPVPHGPTLTAKPGWPESIEVANVDSMLTDHVRYERERDDALALIAEFALRDTRGPIQVSEDERGQIDRARSSRRWRLAVLRVTRWITAAGLAGFLARRSAEVETWGQDGYGWWAENVGVPVWWPASIEGDQAMAAGATGVVLGALGCYLVLSRIWAVWNSVEARALFAAVPDAARNLGHALLTLLVAGWVAVLYVGFVLDDVDDLATGGSALDWFEAVATFGFAIFAVSLLVAGLIRNRSGRKDAPAPAAPPPGAEHHLPQQRTAPQESLSGEAADQDRAAGQERPTGPERVVG